MYKEESVLLRSGVKAQFFGFGVNNFDQTVFAKLILDMLL